MLGLVSRKGRYVNLGALGPGKQGADKGPEAPRWTMRLGRARKAGAKELVTAKRSLYSGCNVRGNGGPHLHEKPLHWVGSSEKKDFRTFPGPVQSNMGPRSERAEAGKISVPRGTVIGRSKHGRTEKQDGRCGSRTKWPKA